MKIVKLTKHKDGYTLDSSAYSAYASSVEHRVSGCTLSFIKNDWHYNPSDKRCLHDAKLLSITIAESETDEIRNCNVEILLQSAYGLKISLQYFDVLSYSCRKTKTQWPSGTSTHGDLLIDELLVNKSGTLSHELVFEDAKILIKFLDFSYRHET